MMSWNTEWGPPPTWGSQLSTLRESRSSHNSKVPSFNLEGKCIYCETALWLKATITRRCLNLMWTSSMLRSESTTLKVTIAHRKVEVWKDDVTKINIRVDQEAYETELQYYHRSHRIIVLIIKLRAIYTQQAHQSWWDKITVKVKISYENREGIQIKKFATFTWVQYLSKEMKNTTQEEVSIMIVSKQDVRKFRIRLEHYFTLIVTILSIRGYQILYKHSVWIKDIDDRT